MPVLPRLGSLWRNLFRRARVEQDLADELAAHLEMLIAARVAAGLPPDEARRQALLELGGLEQVKEEVRAVRIGAHLDAALQDLRYGLRTLRRSPGFTLVVVLTLGLGIGAPAAIFSLVNAVLLRPLPVAAPGELVLFSDGPAMIFGGPLRPGRLPLASYPLYQRLRAGTEGFDDLAAQQAGETASVVGGGERDVAFGRAVSTNYFRILGVAAFRGRVFLPEDETAAVVVLGHRYWQRRLAGAAVIGTSLAINGASYTVVGVGPPGFSGTAVERATDFWVPVAMQPVLSRSASRLAEPQRSWLLVIGRLRPGASLAAADASANVVLQRFLADNPALARPEDRPRIRIGLERGPRGVSQLRGPLRGPLLALSAGTGLLLLIVCLDLSHLLLARGIRRGRELAIRAALGAGRWRLLRQLFTEGLLLAALGGAAALVASRLLAAGLLALPATEGTSLALDVSADARTLAFTAALAAGCALVLGLVPAWRATAGGLDLRGATGRRRPRGRWLLASQVAGSLVLLVGAGLLAASLRNLRGVDKGFDEQHLLQVDLNTPMAGVVEQQALPRYDDLVARLGALPGVRSASLSQSGLLTGDVSLTRINLPGTTALLDSTEVLFGIVTPAYFDTMGMTLLRGRGFTAADRDDAPRVAVVNEAMARRHFGDALGKRFVVPRTPRHSIEVVGVLRDVRASGLASPAPPMLYLPVAQEPGFLRSLQVRVAGNPALVAADVRRVLRERWPALPVLGLRTMREQVDHSLASERILATLAVAFGLAALLLVALGLHGVVGQWVAQRTAELGVRLALGASPAGVRWLVTRQALGLALAGLLLGGPAALGASWCLKGLLFGLGPQDPTTLVLASLGLLCVAAAAAYLPARRASRLDPVISLRAE